MFTHYEMEKRKSRLLCFYIALALFLSPIVFHDPIISELEKIDCDDLPLRIMFWGGLGLSVFCLLTLLPFLRKRIKVWRLIKDGRYIYAPFDGTSTQESYNIYYDASDPSQSNRYNYNYTAYFAYNDDVNQVHRRFYRDYESLQFFPFHKGDQARVYVKLSDSDTFYVSENHIVHPAGYNPEPYREKLTGRLIGSLFLTAVTAFILVKSVLLLEYGVATWALATCFIILPFFLLTISSWFVLKNKIVYNHKIR